MRAVLLDGEFVCVSKLGEERGERREERGEGSEARGAGRRARGAGREARLAPEVLTALLNRKSSKFMTSKHGDYHQKLT